LSSNRDGNRGERGRSAKGLQFQRPPARTACLWRLLPSSPLDSLRW